MVSLHVPRSIFEELHDQMIRGRDEQVAFLYASVEGEKLLATELHAVPPEGFVSQSTHHLALTDGVRAEVLGRAAALGSTLVEAHSHPGARTACFSPTDLDGFEEWVPHVRWRLGGAPYVALVFASGDIDALVWTGVNGKVDALAQLEAGGLRVRLSNLTIDHFFPPDE